MSSLQTTKVLNEIESRKILQKYNINQNKFVFTDSLEKTLAATYQLEYPLVMKVVSDKIIHKSDFGGVHVGLKNEEDVKVAHKQIFENASKKNVNSCEVDGVSIQEMENGIEEMLIGVKRDQVFGPVILIGLGGVLVELMEDVLIGICPLSEEDIYRMIKRLKGYPLLDGYRGRTRADIDSFVATVIKVQELVVNESDIIEMDLNPVIVKENGKGCVVVDARIVTR